MMMKQRTLEKPLEYAGVGLHTGAATKVRCLPAPEDHGVVFVRMDLAGHPRLPVHIDHVTDAPRRTTLKRGEAEVHTIEHLLATFYALGITNALVEIDGLELPGLDGSARPICQALTEAGVLEQTAERRRLQVTSTIAIADGDANIVAVPSEGGLTISYTLNYPGSVLPSQHLSLAIDPQSFAREIAPARTFCMEDEAAALLDAGLGKGASYENTLVLGSQGVINNELRFPDEFVRHKILDLLGDLFLLGMPLDAHIIAVKSGHGSNRQLVRRLLQAHQAQKDQDGHDGIYTEEPSLAAVELDIRKIQKILPHRFPMLMLDRILELEEGKRAVGLKNVSMNEPYFQGHYPGQPVMPGVLQIEAMAQLAGVLMYRKSENINRLAYLMSLDNVKFRKTVVPGDQLVLEAEAMKIKGDRAQVRTKATVNGKVVTEAVIRFMLVDAS